MNRHESSRTGLAAICVLTVAIASPVAALVAQTCTVPGTHATIQEAIDDMGCAQIDLAGQTYGESINVSRSLTLTGPSAGGAVVEGFVRVAGVGTTAHFQDLVVRNGCLERALLAHVGATVDGTRLTVERSAGLPCPASHIFTDGFESGDISAWSGSLP